MKGASRHQQFSKISPPISSMDERENGRRRTRARVVETVEGKLWSLRVSTKQVRRRAATATKALRKQAGKSTQHNNAIEKEK